MRSTLLQRWLIVVAMLALPILAHAQEATLRGTVKDTTGGALPGVTVRAVHEATGNNFEAVTDAAGEYLLSVRVGPYRVTAELSGFAPVTRTLSLLVGQEAVLNLEMGVSAVEETVTVTGEAPLLDVTQSTLGGNIDPRQMQELPVQGRNWMDLVMLAPGSRANDIQGAPVMMGGVQSRGDFGISLDGQNLTNLAGYVAGTRQAEFSRDAIAEFEFVSARFDATQGRSNGVQVRAITKSGTNNLSGSFAGYFRDDRFNAADHVVNRVLPYSNQQFSTTFGGPIRRDRVHYFGHYEYEREPLTIAFTTRYPSFNQDIQSLNTEHKGGVRLDTQFSSQTRLTVRGTYLQYTQPANPVTPVAGDSTSTATPSSVVGRGLTESTALTTFTQVFGNNLVHEVKVGANINSGRSIGRFKSPSQPSGHGGPRILAQGITLGGGSASGLTGSRNTLYSIRDDLTYTFTRRGRHILKFGAEYVKMRVNSNVNSHLGANGTLDARGGPLPANVENLFPDLYKTFRPGTWMR